MPLASILAGGLLKLAEPIVDALFETEDERAAAKIKLMQADQQGKLQEAEVQLSAIIAEANSSDPWTSRARPTFLYVIYVFILSAIPMGVLFAFEPGIADDVTTGVMRWLDALPSDLLTLFGVGYLGYTGARSLDKLKGRGK